MATPLAWASSFANHLRVVLTEPKDLFESANHPLAKDRKLLQAEFYEKFEDLIDVITAAAQFGTKPTLENTYVDLKNYMIGHYEAIRPFVVAYLKTDPEDEHFGITNFGKRTDAFEALWVADSLETLLAADDSYLIDRITRSREAICLYGEHLRYLLARSE